ncbi:MAG TPA: nucleoside recognition domain-containing protein [Rectinemataceae bacterium]|nr:nucleoside recognition domain-containing protein [Rectinemataceae bacterium]
MVDTPKPSSRGLRARFLGAIMLGVRSAGRTTVFLLKIIVPVSLAVAILGWSGILERIAAFTAPLMRLLGLSGDAALVFISSILLNIYSALAVAGSLALDHRQTTILAIMCLTAHNLIMETAVMRKAGSSAWKMVALRLVMAVVVGWLFNLLLPRALGASAMAAVGPASRPELLAMLLAWAASTLRLALRIIVIVLAIMIAQRLLEEFRVMDWLAGLLSPFMRLLGLPRRASFLWIVINVVGYAYGAGIIVEQIETGGMTKEEGDLLNHHAGMCHSLMEDTALFLAAGCPLVWITLPRLALAVAVVWLELLRRRLFRSGPGVLGPRVGA